jgi:hypothetical protein
MIVSATYSNVLEFFWRHRAKTAIFRMQPADFGSLRTRAADGQRMRDWLALQPGCTSIGGLDDPRIIKRLADAVRSREIAVAELPATSPRLPGTGVALTSLHGPVLLLPYRKLAQAADVSYALKWLQGLDGNQIEWLRAILSETDEWSSRDIDDAADIRVEIERLLKSGELIPVCTHYPTLDREKIAEWPAFEPPDLKRLSEPTDIVEASTFSPDHEAAAQANTMIAAAESGVPFCEVCNRK